MEELDSVRQVESFVLDGAFWPTYDDWRRIRREADSWRTHQVLSTDLHVSLPPGQPRGRSTFPPDPVKAAGGSQWEQAFLTVSRVRSPESDESARRLLEVRAWWGENVRGRIYREPLAGLGIYLTEPPRAEVPYPLPEQLRPGHWVDAVQQLAWWQAVRRVDKSRHTARQVDGWQRMREAAASVYDPEIRQVLGVVTTHTTRATAVAQLRRRAQQWA